MGNSMRARWIRCVPVLVALTACSSDDEGSIKEAPVNRGVGAPVGAAGRQASPSPGTGAAGQAPIGPAGSGVAQAGTAAQAPGGMMMNPAAPGGPGPGMTPAMPGPGPMMSPMMPPPPMTPHMGPLDGDPSKPMVSIDGIPCGVPRAGFGASPPTVKITNRDVVVAYPCAHEGAAVTFFLFLHGTLGDAQKVPFTMNAFPIHNYVDSDNVIVVVPKAVGNQWGNGDNGADAPHLAEVVDWVYDTFGEKFSIRSMWASGGSWGAFYLGSTFACDPKYENRLRGVRMVVGGGCPRCSNRLACIVAQQELELGMGMPLSDEAKEMATVRANIEPYAMAHGCEPKTGPTDLGPVRAWTWANCDKGWAHSYYLGPGQHADPWNDPTAMKHMVAEIKSIEN